MFVQDGSRNVASLLGVGVPATSRGAESGGRVDDVAHESEGLGVAEHNVSVSVVKQRAATKAEIKDMSRKYTEATCLRCVKDD